LDPLQDYVVDFDPLVKRVPLERSKGRRASGDHGESTPQAVGRPSNLKRTVTPKRLPNRDLRTREHLTEAEVERLMDAARGNRLCHRDATMVLVTYRHGL